MPFLSGPDPLPAAARLPRLPGCLGELAEPAQLAVWPLPFVHRQRGLPLRGRPRHRRRRHRRLLLPQGRVLLQMLLGTLPGREQKVMDFRIQCFHFGAKE